MKKLLRARGIDCLSPLCAIASRVFSATSASSSGLQVGTNLLLSHSTSTYEAPAFVARVRDVSTFVQAVFDQLEREVLVLQDSSVVLRLAVDKGGSTTKIIVSFVLRRCSNSPFAFFPIVIYDGK